MEYLAIYFCCKVYSLKNLFEQFYSFADKLSCSLENEAIFWNIQLFSVKVLFCSWIVFCQIWKRLYQKTCSFFENKFSQPAKCIILFQLSMSSSLLHPKSLLSSFSSLKSSSLQNQEFGNLISLNSLSKPARSDKRTNFFLTKEITRHSGIKTSFSGLYIHKKNGNLAKTCV